MEHKIKTLAEATTNTHLKKLIQTHVKELMLKEAHLVIYVDNAGPLHEMEGKEMDEHLKKALEKLYSADLTYELKLHKSNGIHEREKVTGKRNPW